MRRTDRLFDGSWPEQTRQANRSGAANTPNSRNMCLHRPDSAERSSTWVAVVHADVRARGVPNGLYDVAAPPDDPAYVAGRHQQAERSVHPFRLLTQDLPSTEAFSSSVVQPQQGSAAGEAQQNGCARSP